MAVGALGVLGAVAAVLSPVQDRKLEHERVLTRPPTLVVHLAQALL